MIAASPFAQSRPSLWGLPGNPSIFTTTPFLRRTRMPQQFEHTRHTLGIQTSSPSNIVSYGARQAGSQGNIDPRFGNAVLDEEIAEDRRSADGGEGAE